MLSQDEVSKIVLSSPKSSGRHANFVVIGKLGFKYYKCVSQRDTSWELQNKAYGLGIAPKPHDKVDFQIGLDGLKLKLYGFFTDIVDLALHHEESDQLKHDRYTLENTLYELGFENASDDLHDGNWGYLNGKPVCIDLL